MEWIFNFQLFLFDFDGLLVDTEKLHYQAYKMMCANRGFNLNWPFERYSQAAHHSSTGLRDQIYAEFPPLHRQEPNWHVLYEEKKRSYLDLIENGTVPLMRGVEKLLLALKKTNLNRCVVTHSPSNFIKHIRKQNPILDSIPHWLTREDYLHPKPHPECYQTAIAKLSKPGDKIIGFEDSPRGLQALMHTNAKPVLICPPDSDYLSSLREQYPFLNYYPSFEAIQQDSFQ